MKKMYVVEVVGQTTQFETQIAAKEAIRKAFDSGLVFYIKTDVKTV